MGRFKLFEVFGIELEYMIVDKKTMMVAPVADQLFKLATGQTTNDVEGDRVDWSNELVLHVAEFKNAQPENEIYSSLPFFQKEVRRANELLSQIDCQLLPTAMHPTMNPEVHTKLWPHENNEIYSSYDRIFSCKGHGWSNLQSLHINISFATDDEFAKLHSAIRFLVSLVPALSSSSPIYESQIRPTKSSRLQFYLQNQRRIPSIIGHAVPDVIQSYQQYQDQVLKPMYRDIAPFDPNGTLQHEWLNSRCAIPKFERGCVEIRLADVQEAPQVDLAIATLWTQALKNLVHGSWIDIEKMNSISTGQLRAILDGTVKNAENFEIKDLEYLGCFGISKPLIAQDLIGAIFSRVKADAEMAQAKLVVEQLLRLGSLSSRILKALPHSPTTDEILAVYRRLATCLQTGELFEH